MRYIAESHIKFLGQECGSFLTGEVLDIGAGPSSLCRCLVKKDAGVRVTALDFHELVLMAQEIYEIPANFKWVAGDFLDWEPPTLFDAAYCGHLLEYCPRDDLPRWLRKIRYFIKDDGHLALIVFLRVDDRDASDDLEVFEISTGLNGADLGHILNRVEIADVLRHTGFTNIKIKTVPNGPSYSEYLVTCQACQCKEACES